ncbi:hypothetical protein PENANT_c028G05528 [Penicillium antarcticum]|uniref:Secreted protein CSS2 C-terminal domain-containing protein n=1 Tax=Penicillium antarcticum TaxID=416450 RepID=A0A1V6PWC9_9EURO|nr:uncharacterized protein N7508_009092 [Penicillium antarcticum]KAJ5294271.1 hypothetical protein N7508_009092 [Penicillium antarcticum]OQD81318.1 hypothetical protein PENANT_c028G05528 [Penicillium antarcticum]
MVNASKIVSALFAFGLVGGGSAEYNATDGTVTYFPLSEEWAGEGSDMTVSFDKVHADYISVFNGTDSLEKRRIIDVEATAAVVTAGSSVILAANAGINIYNFIADVIKSKSNSNSCSMTIGSDSDGHGHVEGYAYEATTSGSKCDTTSERKTILAAVRKCADWLHTHGAVTGCCQFSHGGTWKGHLRLSANNGKYPASSVRC